jgi:cytochrome b561
MYARKARPTPAPRFDRPCDPGKDPILAPVTPASHDPADATFAPAYKPIARGLHWLIALALHLTIPVGLMMVMPGWARPAQDAMFVFHKNIGVVILILMVLRLVYRLFNPPPPLPASLPAPQRLAAEATHWALYLLVFVMAVSGYIRVKAGGFPLEGLDAIGVPSLVPRDDALAGTAKTIHATTRYALIAVILMHVGAAAFHGIVKRDGVFSRMWPRRRAA